MKKLFFLFAFLTCFMGAKAVEIVDLEMDYSTVTSEWNGGWRSESAAARVSIQDGCMYFHSEEAVDPFYDVQFQAFGVPSSSFDSDASYTITLTIKGTVAQSLHASFSGSNTPGEIPVTTDWQTVVLEGCKDDPSAAYFASSGQLLIQCGDYVGEWWISNVKITHEGKEERPVEWIEQLTNGDAETPWTEEQKATRFNDQENNFKIVAWGKEKGVNMNDDGGWDPFPATIEEVDGSHVFVVHGKPADTEGDPSAWDNQFWIQAPNAKVFKVGNQFKLHFRYKASEEANTNTQFHHQNPSDYVHWQAVGDVKFTTEWQEFDGVFTVPDAATDAWSIAFNLNPENKNAIDFYFDDLSVSTMKLDEGLFVAASNTKTGTEYDFDNAIAFVQDDDLMIATVGTKGKQDSWVNEVMISTVRGNDKAYKGATIKPTGTVVNDPDTWLDYTEGSNAKIKLPAAGVWTISIDTEGKQINFVKLEGEEEVGPIEINPNPTSVTVNGVERDYTESEQEGGTGFAWDNQFWIMANRTLSAGEETIVEFDYVANKEAKTTTQCHAGAGEYLHWAAIGDVNFTTEEQHFSGTFTVPAEADGMQSIAFNMAEIKEACDYTIKNVVWKLADNTESLINQTGGENFWLKISAGTTPYQYEETAINGVTVNKKSSTAIYNLAGQRVSKTYKGIVVKDGKKYIAK
jgi:hypothetical protein